MDRRTFLKAAAVTPALATSVQSMVLAPQAPKPWPQTAYFDNPIGNGLFPLQFVETLPLVVRARAHSYAFAKNAVLFSFIPHEWITDAVLFRGMEIKPRNPADLANRELQDIKLSLYVDDSRVADGFRVGDFMVEGGRAFRLWDRDVATKILYGSCLGWSDKGSSDPDRFLGYFLPDKTCISVKAEGSIEAEVKCDMARYTAARTK